VEVLNRILDFVSIREYLGRANTTRPIPQLLTKELSMASPSRICSNCGSSNLGIARFCSDCASPLTVNSVHIQPKESLIAIKVIRVCAWLALFLGLFMGILHFVYGSVYIGRGGYNGATTGIITIVNGITYIIGGIVGAAFLFVLAGIAADLKEVKHNTRKR
jgi:hypothetical protein